MRPFIKLLSPASARCTPRPVRLPERPPERLGDRTPPVLLQSFSETRLRSTPLDASTPDALDAPRAVSCCVPGDTAREKIGRE